jgi:arylsulfatase A-like enzyme
MLACTAEVDRPRAQNAILITCDTLRADRLGVYGHAQGTSPELDRFARGALVFERAFSSAPWTQPAVSSLLSGLLPEEIGVTPSNLRRMPAQVETLAEGLAAAGFATAAVVSNSLLSKVRKEFGDIGSQQGFQHYDDQMTTRERNRASFERVAADTTAAALGWLDQHQAAGGGRFFLWVHYQDPHGPYTPPAEYLGDSTSAPTDEPSLPIGTKMTGRRQIPQYQNLDGETRPSVYRERYEAEIRYFDAELGRLLRGLDSRGFLEPSVVVFTADHGESLGERDVWFAHGENVHVEEVRVPLLVRPPGGLAEGPVRVPTLAGHVDVWPTIFDALDLPTAPKRGVSLLDPDGRGAERVLVQSLVPRNAPDQAWAITDGRYRALWSAREPAPKLFDLDLDPGELHDLAAINPERAAGLVRRHAELMRSLVSLGDAASEAALSAQEQANLRALGYIELDRE